MEMEPISFQRAITCIAVRKAGSGLARIRQAFHNLGIASDYVPASNRRRVSTSGSSLNSVSFFLLKICQYTFLERIKEFRDGQLREDNGPFTN